MDRSPPSFQPHFISRALVHDTPAMVARELTLLLVSAMCESVFFGLYTTLFAFSTFIVLRKGLSNRTKKAMLAVSVVMYAISATHWALFFAISIETLKLGKFTMTPKEALVFMYLPTINYILGDAIVLWRAWLLWDRRIVLFILPFFFLVCTIVTTTVTAIYEYDSYITRSVSDANKGYAFGKAVWAFTLATNLWATSLMFIRAWQHRRLLRSLLGEENAKSKAEKVIAFLAESGVIYLCIWVVYVTIAVCGMRWVIILDKSLVQLVGIYPTVIVVVITMRLTATDILTRPGGEPRSYLTPIGFIPRSPSLQISEAGSNDSDTEIRRKVMARQDL